MKKQIFSIGVLLASLNVFAEPIQTGTYIQRSVKPAFLGECPTCTITITHVTPNLISIKSNNGWYGYAVYHSDKDMYYGHSQWEKDKGANYASNLYTTEIKFDGKTVVYKGKSLNPNLSGLETTYTRYSF